MPNSTAQINKMRKRTIIFSATILAQVTLALFPSMVLLSQSTICNGIQGNNIFTSGDFGRGPYVIYPNDPGLAPGFIYTTQVPPTDGQYTLTNNMSLWPSIWPTWLKIGDNSPDPLGYMMVINASVNPGIFYEQIVNGICEKTTYEFSADVINLIRSGISSHTLPNVTFLIDDVVVYSTGQIPQDEKWHTYGSTFTTSLGQTSLKLTLRNNAPGGGGNDLALDNISFRTCGPLSSISIDPPGRICDETLFPVLTAHVDTDSFALQWQLSLDSGMVWNNISGAVDTTYQINELSTGIYYYRFLYGTSRFNLTSPNCRIVSDSIRVEIVPIEYRVADTLCEGLIFTFGGIEYTETGIYHQHLTAANGCDSLITIDLLFIPDPPIIAEFTVKPPSCLGAGDGSISVYRVTGTRPPFIFYVNNILVPPPSTSVKVPAGTYTVRVENEYGCFDEQQIFVPDGPVFQVNTIDDATITLGHSIQLGTTSNVPVWMAVWEPSYELSCTNCITPIATPLVDQTYFITAETSEGCIDSDSVRIRVEKEPVLFIPNIFSPNNDGRNDFFEISTDPLNVVSIDHATIFDRWGGIMTQITNPPNEGQVILWDGYTSRGKAIPGMYVYIIEFTLANGSSRIWSGDVTVVP